MADKIRPLSVLKIFIPKITFTCKHVTCTMKKKNNKKQLPSGINCI